LPYFHETFLEPEVVPARRYTVPRVKLVENEIYKVQPNMFIERENNRPYMTFTNEEFDYDDLSKFQENIQTWVKGKFFSFKLLKNPDYLA